MKREKIFLGVFAVVIAAVQGAFWCMPRENVSKKEKRVLSAPPHASWSRIADGRFMEQAEAYLMDYFPGRESLVGANAYFRQAEGLNAVGEITRGQDNWLIAAPLADKRETLNRNVSVLQDFLNTAKKPAAAPIVRTTGAVEAAMLPRLHAPYPDEVLLGIIRDALPADWCDVLDTFRTHSASERLYYRTDHHWTTEGAYEAYRIWCAKTNRLYQNRSAGFLWHKLCKKRLVGGAARYLGGMGDGRTCDRNGAGRQYERAYQTKQPVFLEASEGSRQISDFFGWQPWARDH